MAATDSIIVSEDEVKFQCLALRFTKLINRRSEDDRQYINSLFDELNSLDFTSPIVNNSDKSAVIIKQCCYIVPPTDTFLVAKGCQLISNLIAKQHVKVEGKTLSDAISWCIQSLKCCREIAVLDILQALESLLRGNANNIDEQIHELVGRNGILIPLLNEEYEAHKKSDELLLASEWEIQLMTVKCLESLTFIHDSKGETSSVERLKQPYLEICAKIFLKLLYTEKRPEQSDFIYCKMLIASLRGLQNLMQQSADLLVQFLGESLGAIKTYMLYGLSGFSVFRPQQVFPSKLLHCDIKQTPIRDGRGCKSVRIRNRNLQQQQNISGSTVSRNDEDNEGHGNIQHSSFRMYTSENGVMPSENAVGSSLFPGWIKTSDSDFSDTESGLANKMSLIQGRVRQAALSLFLIIAKVCERKILFGYWSSFLPDEPNMLQISTLCTCLHKDPSSHNRMLVLQSVTIMLVGSRLYLCHAEESSKSSVSFTPFSVTVGNMVRGLHYSFCSALSTENSIPVITQLLKCLAALIQNTPYHRLDHGLLSKVVTSVSSYIGHKDSSIQVAALTVLGSIVAVNPVTSEVTDIVSKCSLVNDREQNHEASEHKEDSVENNKDKYHDDLLDDSADVQVCDIQEVNEQMSWLLKVCVRNLHQPVIKEEKRNTTSMKIEGATGLPVCAVPVRVESLQVLTLLARNHYALVMSKHLLLLTQVIEQTITDSDTAVCLHTGRVIDALGTSMQQCLLEQGEMKAVLLDRNLIFWQTVLSGPFISLIQNAEKPALRSVGCDCLATVGSEVFELLPHEKQILVITLLFGCSNDEESSVRASAVRALAIYILFPVLREDIYFIIHSAENIIRTVEDESSLVRMKASWSLGNLTDALVLNSMNGNIVDIPEELFFRLMEISIKAAHDNEKVRCNAVRAVGNFIRLVTKDMMNTSSFKECADKAIAALVRNATTGNNMKVRWNACYAIGNMMRNTYLYSENSTWQNSVFTTLTKLVQSVRNFKVRINAALALSIPSSRQFYGPYYIAIWNALLAGLDNSQNMEDFNEYKHRDNLLDQICLTLSHLASMATRDDLGSLHDVLVFHLDTLQQHLLKFHERVVPEKTSVLTAASSHATSLLQLPNLSFSQHNAAVLLTSLFLQETDITLPCN
ncbi:HEAT repeat-containing protein 6 isoform X3 [Periplaneta americana]|uniref:HEAT repeat-containing protein 6 isoform X3 n=1 Tax=Periplaneta americana TaxID=6978 RepID=UPI0037E7A864